VTDKHGDCIAIGSPYARRSPNGFWTRERIAEAIRLWSERYGEPPSACDWNSALAYKNKDARYLGHAWPRLATVQTKFGSWNDALAAAGFEPRGIGVHGPWKWAKKKRPSERKYPARRHRDGFVYCALAVEAQIVKIGFTKGDPARRVACIQVGCPHRLELIKVRHGGSTEEKRLHDLLRPHCTSGEWFSFNEPVMTAIFSKQEPPLG
jgi:hypothetical protein